MDSLAGPVPCSSSDLPGLRELLNQALRRERGIERDLLDDYPTVYVEGNRENLLVFKDGDQVVSHVGYKPQRIRLNAEVLQAGMVAGVATLRPYRNRGLASRLLEAVEAKMVRDGMDVGVLWSPLPDFYRRLGWELAGRMGRLEILRPEELGLTVEVRPYQGEAVELERFRQAAKVNEVLRGPQDAPLLFGCTQWEVLVARQEGRVAGYATLYRGAGVPSLNDLDGSAEAVCSLINHLFRREGAGRLAFCCSPSSLARRAVEARYQTRYSEINSGIWKVLNREAFYRKVASAFGRPDLRVPDELLSDPRVEAQWVFGPCLDGEAPSVPVPLCGPFPLDLHVSYTDHV